MKKPPSRILLACAGALLAAMAGACARAGSEASGPGSAVARVRAAGVLRWGADTQGGEPHVYPNPQNPAEIIGFEVDLANALGRELGVRAEFVQNDWSHL